MRLAIDGGLIGKKPQAVVINLWEKLAGATWITMKDLPNNAEGAQTLLELCAISDETCAGAGQPQVVSTPQDPFYFFVDSLLRNESDGASLCCEINKSKLRVS